MQNQDPMDPTSPTDFMSELAKFSTVEGVTQLNSTSVQQSLTQIAMLIGQTVEYTDAKNKAASGVVSSVTMNNGQVALVINNNDVNLSQLTAIDSESSKGIRDRPGCPFYCRHGVGSQPADA